jgi:hypothetical protein
MGMPSIKILSRNVWSTRGKILFCIFFASYQNFIHPSIMFNMIGLISSHIVKSLEENSNKGH